MVEPVRSEEVAKAAEDRCIKIAPEDFDKNHALTEQQEEKIEILYKEKSILTPDKKSSNDYSFKESTPKKGRPRKLFAKDVLIASKIFPEGYFI
jgi:hypothetical protein